MQEVINGSILVKNPSMQNELIKIFLQQTGMINAVPSDNIIGVVRTQQKVAHLESKLDFVITDAPNMTDVLNLLGSTVDHLIILLSTEEEVTLPPSFKTRAHVSPVSLTEIRSLPTVIRNKFNLAKPV